jgi:hypothetical protein
VSLLALDLNDAGILAVGEDGTISLANPGFALFEEDALTVGRNAASKSRLDPRRIHTRMWSELDTKSLKRPFPTHLRTADLVHAHLDQIWAESAQDVDRVILAIPGRYSEHQLGLILGIADACRMPVTGLVDSAVASAADSTLPSAALHLDLQLHDAVLTVLSRNGGLGRIRVEVADFGLAELHGCWAKLIAGEFLRTTRFDPLHLAETEQALYDRLPLWLREVRSAGSARVAMRSGDLRHTIEVPGELFAKAAAAIYDRLEGLVRELAHSDDRPTLALSHRAAILPGFADHLQRTAQIELTSLPIAAAAVGAIRHARHIEEPGETKTFVTRLPIDDPNTADADATAGLATAHAGQPPTHLLYAGVAHEITHEPFAIGTEDPQERPGLGLSGDTAGITPFHCSLRLVGELVILEDHSGGATLLNGRPVEGTAELTAGDRLLLGTPGIELALIRVEG